MEDASIIPLTASGPATRDPAYLLGFIVTPKQADGYAQIYEGQGKGTGRKLFCIHAGARRTRSVILPAPVPCERGIYVDFTADVLDAAVIYRPFSPIEP